MHYCIMENYIFLHHTKNIKEILKSGYLVSGSLVKKSKRHFSPEPLDYVFMYAYFYDLHKSDHILCPTLVFKPNILEHYDAIFNNDWLFGKTNSSSIILKKSDSDKTRENQINKIKTILENPKLMPTGRPLPSYSQQEFLFAKKINLKKYLDGIIVDCLEEKETMAIKKYLKKYGYENVKIYNSALN